jgi:hypothetical protein
MSGHCESSKLGDAHAGSSPVWKRQAALMVTGPPAEETSANWPKAIVAQSSTKNIAIALRMVDLVHNSGAREAVTP